MNSTNRLSNNPPPEEETQADRDRIMAAWKNEPFGYVKTNLGPLGYAKTPYFGLKKDWAFSNCMLALINVLGSAMWVRYYKHDIVARA